MEVKKKTNPLRSARNAAGVRAQEIWFRKSATGSLLFLEYYASQPWGTVACDAGRAEESIIPENAVSVQARDKKRGMSRAAQRKRKKKKTRGNHVDGSAEEEAALSHDSDKTAPETSLQDTRSEDEHSPCDDSSSSLWKAWQDFVLSEPSVVWMEPFVKALSRGLPVTVRIRETADKSKLQQIRSTMAEWSPPPVSMHCNKNIWKLPCPKHKLSPSVKASLLHYSTNGVLARQELGSMLPVLAVGSKLASATAVLDMCASPGSKTLQAWERMEAKDKKKTILFVANDVHSKRLEALQEAVERSGVSCPKITYSCQDARNFTLRTASGKLQLFDIILCDVPCSGDGTCRKDRHILPQWKPNIANDLHSTQLSILRRGLELLRPDGLLCYSTCSLNPVENEAVVAAALKGDNSDKYELVDIRVDDGLQLRNGLTHGWKVAVYSDSSEPDGLEWLDAKHETSSVRLTSTLWPPPIPITSLSSTKRLLPQDQDTGGFYLALFRCKDKQ